MLENVRHIDEAQQYPSERLFTIPVFDLLIHGPIKSGYTRGCPRSHERLNLHGVARWAVHFVRLLPKGKKTKMKKVTDEHKHERSHETERKDADPREAALQEAREVLAKAINADERSFNPHISMYSLALTLLQLVELFDSQPGKEQRMKVLDQLAKQFSKFTSLHQK